MNTHFQTHEIVKEQRAIYKSTTKTHKYMYEYVVYCRWSVIIVLRVDTNGCCVLHMKLHSNTAN